MNGVFPSAFGMLRDSRQREKYVMNCGRALAQHVCFTGQEIETSTQVRCPRCKVPEKLDFRTRSEMSSKFDISHSCNGLAVPLHQYAPRSRNDKVQNLSGR